MDIKTIVEDEINIKPDLKEDLIDKTKGESTLTKKQIKKLKRVQKWDEQKKMKKIKKKEMKLLAKSNPKVVSTVKTQEIPSEIQIAPLKKRINKIEKQQHKLAIQKAQPIIIDCSFQPLMTEKEKKSLALQLAYCHSINRKFLICSQIVITSFNGELKEKLTKANAENWGVVLQEKNYLECFDKEKLVYLTGDAEEELDEIENESFYSFSNN